MFSDPSFVTVCYRTARALPQRSATQGSNTHFSLPHILFGGSRRPGKITVVTGMSEAIRSMSGAILFCFMILLATWLVGNLEKSKAGLHPGLSRCSVCYTADLMPEIPLEENIVISTHQDMCLLLEAFI